VTRYLVAATDPLAHALLAAAVVAPLGRGAVRTAVVAGTLIDVDHIVAARSAWPRALIGLETRPRSHAMLGAVALGAVGAASGGSIHGWAAFAGLASHLLRDASDDAAPTPLLWPWRPPRQIGRGWAAAGVAALALGSVALARASRRAAARARPASAGAAGAAADTARPRTA
jgi:hypothetical protein